MHRQWAGFCVFTTMTNLQIQRREQVISNEDMAGDGPGGFQCYASKFYELDSYGTMMMPGAFKDTIPQFLERGFVAHSHEWEMDGVIGYATSVVEDGTGLLCDVTFHTTDDAQEIRKVMQERTAAGKGCYTSVGFTIKSSVSIAPEAYATELAKYVPAPYLAKAQADAMKYPWGIELITGVELYEFSVVSVPACRGAEVISVRSGEPNLRAGLRFADEAEAVLAAAKALLLRAQEIQEKREKDGRSISDNSKAKLRGVFDRLVELRDASGDAAEAMATWLENIEPAPEVAPVPDLTKARAQKALAESLALKNNTIFAGAKQ